jgi:hypothetical protein
MTVSLRLRLLALAAALVLSAAAAPSAAHAAANLETGIADDAVLFREKPADAARSVAAWQSLGIDNVRVFAKWGAISPASGGRRPPAGFDAANPQSPGYDWSGLDRAVALVRGARMTVTLTVTGPGPLWATSQPSAGDPRLRPRPELFGRFARAVALRYGANVDRYIVWNEPNVPLWLKPQFNCRGRRCTPASPHLYRRLALAAYPAIHAADRNATVLIGALAPRGQNPRARNATMRPLPFLRALGCVSERLRRVRTGDCRGFHPARADAIAYHPHGVRRAPDVPNPNEDEASLADLPRLERLLDGIQRSGGLRNSRGRTRRFDLYFSEYGYQTRPPDRVDGVRPAEQAKWLQQAAYIAWRNPRVKNLTQYVWRDEQVFDGRKSGWQSGLLFRNARTKPALRGFSQPFWTDQTVARGSVRLWGQVRPGGAQTVRIQRSTPGSNRWATIRTMRTDRRGFFAMRARVTKRVDYRFTSKPAAGGALRTSDSRRVTPQPARSSRSSGSSRGR